MQFIIAGFTIERIIAARPLYEASGGVGVEGVVLPGRLLRERLDRSDVPNSAIRKADLIDGKFGCRFLRKIVYNTDPVISADQAEDQIILRIAIYPDLFRIDRAAELYCVGAACNGIGAIRGIVDRVMAKTSIEIVGIATDTSIQRVIAGAAFEDIVPRMTS